MQHFWHKCSEQFTILPVRFLLHADIVSHYSEACYQARLSYYKALHFTGQFCKKFRLSQFFKKIYSSLFFPFLISSNAVKCNELHSWSHLYTDTLIARTTPKHRCECSFCNLYSHATYKLKVLCCSFATFSKTSGNRKQSLKSPFLNISILNLKEVRHQYKWGLIPHTVHLVKNIDEKQILTENFVLYSFLLLKRQSSLHLQAQKNLCQVHLDRE